MSRTVPERTPAQQKAADRIVALRIGTPAAVRAWAERYDVPLIDMEDDDLLLISIHDARAELFPDLRAASLAWLRANKARILAEREGSNA
jgi:hypothetical protein